MHDQLLAKLPSDFFSKLGVQRGDLREDNPAFEGMTLEEIFKLLEKAKIIIAAFRAINPEFLVSDMPQEYPVFETLMQCQPSFLSKINQRARLAIQKKDGGLLRKSLIERARVQAIYKDFGAPLVLSNGLFDPGFQVLVDAYLAYFSQNLPELTPQKRAEQYIDFAEIMFDISISVAGQDQESTSQQMTVILNRLVLANNLLASALAAVASCDALAQELTSRGHVIPVGDPSNEGNESLPISGQFESEDDSSTLVTLQINQAGRFFQGTVQFHSSTGRSISSDRLQGLYAGKEAGNDTFAFLRLDGPNGQILGSGKLIVSSVDDTLSLSYREEAGMQIDFKRTSPMPAYSDQMILLFPEYAQPILVALKEAPLHSVELSQIANTTESLKARIRNYIRNDSSRPGQAAQINDLIRDLRSGLSLEQDPLIRLFLQLSLSAAYPSVDALNNNEPVLDDNDMPYQNWLLTIFNRHRSFMSATGSVLGLVPEVDEDTEIFQYEGEVVYAGVGAEVVIGMTDIHLDVTIKKTDPQGNETTLELDGGLIQFDLGVSLPFNATISSDSFTFRSPFDYGVEDLTGPVNTFGVSAAALGVQIQAGLVVFQGSGVLPPVAYVPDVLSQYLGFNVGVGSATGLGMLVPEGQYDQKAGVNLAGNQGIRHFETQTQASFDQPLGFSVNSAELSVCGRQELREFIAEFRVLFGSPSSKVWVIGTTDTTGDDAYNLDLSQQRAETVRSAILEILGSSAKLTEDRVFATGVGEMAAGERFPISAFDTRALKELIRLLRGSRETIADNVDDPSWRNVHIIVSDLIRTQMRSAKELN